MSNPPALQVHALNKSFGGLAVAQNLNLTLNEGARHALIGPNGAGKTTFINLICGVLTPDSGKVLLGGEEVTNLSQAQRAGRGLVRTFQINQLFRNITVAENICLALAERDGIANNLWRPLGTYDELLDEAMALLTRFDLHKDALTLVSALPYGRQRLVEIVIALAQKPKVLLLDEPAAGVPSSESRIILDVISELPDNIAILIIEHDMEVVFRFAKEITVLVSGGLLMSGSPEAVAADQQVKKIYLGESHHG